jgi:hypothetical protein
MAAVNPIASGWVDAKVLAMSMPLKLDAGAVIVVGGVTYDVLNKTIISVGMVAERPSQQEMVKRAWKALEDINFYLSTEEVNLAEHWRHLKELILKQASHHTVEYSDLLRIETLVNIIQELKV